jgi:acyl-CoA reductase-like NAD-dependent aldehyde dehydrogenase
MTALPIHFWINNEEIQTGTYMEVRDPGRLTEVVGTVASANVEHADMAVRAAHQAFQFWRNVDVPERSALLLKAADFLEQEAANLAVILSRETGSVLSVCRSEIAAAVKVLRITVDLAQPFLLLKRAEDEQSWVSVEKRPLGVVVGIIPWNAPVILMMQKLAPALITGNTIVIKPSPNAPITVSLILKKFSEMFPPGVVHVLHGDGQVGSALTTHPLVRKISFTGGGKIAKYVMKDAADSLKRVHFELGGNDPAILLDDANLDEAIPKILASAFKRSGQVCFAIKRVYIPEKMYKTVCDMVCDHIGKFKVGHGLDENATMGPVNNKNQFEYVRQLVQRAKQSRAKVVELGTKLDPDSWDNGYYLLPSVVMNPEPEQEIVTCEQFGPVIPLVSYRTEEEVVRMANGTEYGLGSSIWSGDFERAVSLSRKIEAGMTFINQHELSPLGRIHVPFGGVKQSGMGRENGEIGLSEFIEYHGINYHK